MSLEKVIGMKERTGKKGEVLRGRIDKEAALAKGLGTATMDHHRTGGISLAILASGPQLVKPPPSPIKLNTTPTAKVGDDNDMHRAHTKCVDESVSRIETTMTTPSTPRAYCSRGSA